MKPHRTKPVAAAPAEPSKWGARLGQLGLLLGLSLAVARATMSETLREPFEPAPGMMTLPRGPGPGASMFLDLLCWIPALLALARAWFDSTFRIRWNWLLLPMLLLGLLAPLSMFWAADRFAALVKGMHFLSALILLWGMSQLVRSPAQLRLVAGACAGLLLVLIVNSLQERFVNYPVQKADWYDSESPSSRWAYMKQQGLTESDWAFQQFERKLLSGELRGFGNSSNTIAAVLVLLIGVVAGATVQHGVERRGWFWIVAPALLIPPAVFCLYFTHSRVAMALLLLGALLLLVLWRLGTWIASHARLCYWAGVAAFVLGSAAVVGHGLHHGSLVEKSLTFRWYYWNGAAKMVAERPVLGVGWEGFGTHYTRVRLPQAVEEVKDPHNLLVKAAAELGIVGLILMAGFLARLWWEMAAGATERRSDEATKASEGEKGASSRLESQISQQPTGSFLWLGLVAGLIHLAFAIDWGYPNSAVITLGVIAIAVGAGLLMLGAYVIVRLGGLQPTLGRGLMIGAGMFLLQNLIDFSLFETSAMFVFAVVAGAAMGSAAPHPSVAPVRIDRPALVLAGLGWFGVAIFVAIPVARAESEATLGDQLLHAGRAREAAAQYASAFARVPYNADYSYRASLALSYAGAANAEVRKSLEQSARANPFEVRYFLRLAQLELRQAKPDLSGVRHGYERSLDLDPRNVELRLAYVQVLASLKDFGGARRQFELALEHDAALPADEPRRLSRQRRGEIGAKIGAELPH